MPPNPTAHWLTILAVKTNA